METQKCILCGRRLEGLEEIFCYVCADFYDWKNGSGYCDRIRLLHRSSKKRNSAKSTKHSGGKK